MDELVMERAQPDNFKRAAVVWMMALNRRFHPAHLAGLGLNPTVVAHDPNDRLRVFAFPVLGIGRTTCVVTRVVFAIAHSPYLLVCLVVGAAVALICLATLVGSALSLRVFLLTILAGIFALLGLPGWGVSKDASPLLHSRVRFPSPEVGSPSPSSLSGGAGYFQAPTT